MVYRSVTMMTVVSDAQMVYTGIVSAQMALAIGDRPSQSSINLSPQTHCIQISFQFLGILTGAYHALS